MRHIPLITMTVGVVTCIGIAAAMNFIPAIWGAFFIAGVYLIHGA